MEKYFIGFETENDGFLITLKNTENLKLDHIKQSCYSFFSSKDFNDFKKTILKENNFYSFSNINDLINYQRLNEAECSFIALKNFDFYYIDKNQKPIDLKRELANKNISNIDLENFKFFNNNYKGSEISRELDTFIKKSNLKEIGETFEYNFNYKNKNNITLREQIYKFYEHDIFVIADKLAILGDDDKDFTKIFIINQKKLPNHIQELLKDFKFNENYLSSIANHKSHFYFQLDLVKHSKNNEFLTTLDSLKNVNSLFELDELKPTKNIQNYNYDQIMEKRLRR